MSLLEYSEQTKKSETPPKTGTALVEIRSILNSVLYFLTTQDIDAGNEIISCVAKDLTDTEAPRNYWLSLDKLKQRKFNGYVMHSFPRKNELSDCVDDTIHNLYFIQMRASQRVFQSVFLHQELAQRTAAHAA